MAAFPYWLSGIDAFWIGFPELRGVATGFSELRHVRSYGVIKAHLLFVLLLSLPKKRHKDLLGMFVSKMKAHYFLPIYHCPNPHKKMEEAETPPFFILENILERNKQKSLFSTYKVCWRHTFWPDFRVWFAPSSNRRAVSYFRMVATKEADAGFKSLSSSNPPPPSLEIQVT